ncbi:hypothetical protein AYI70_g10118, partial [Smittium culicis]
TDPGHFYFRGNIYREFNLYPQSINNYISYLELRKNDSLVWSFIGRNLLNMLLDSEILKINHNNNDSEIIHSLLECAVVNYILFLVLACYLKSFSIISDCKTWAESDVAISRFHKQLQDITHSISLATKKSSLLNYVVVKPDLITHSTSPINTTEGTVISDFALLDIKTNSSNLIKNLFEIFDPSASDHLVPLELLAHLESIISSFSQILLAPENGLDDLVFNQYNWSPESKPTHTLKWIVSHLELTHTNIKEKEKIKPIYPLWKDGEMLLF